MIVGLLVSLTWVYLLLFHGKFWLIRERSPKMAHRPSLRIAAIVPARDEAAVIAESITSLLRQNCGALDIFLVDDGSSDGTSQIARDAAGMAGKEITVVESGPLPEGWSGKVWALQQGIEKASVLKPDFFLFTDADVVHAPDSVAALAAIVEDGGYDLASFMVKLHCRGVAEKLLIPAFVFFFFKLYPPAWIADARKKTAGAAGGCILVRPEALARAGGLAAIRWEIIDDCALARAVKRSGGKIRLGVTSSTRSIRCYGSFAEIGRMISRTAFNQLNHSAWMLLAAILGLALIYLAPLGLLLAGPLPAGLGAAAWLMMTVSYLPMVRFYQLNPLWALTLPLAAVFYMGATLHSAVQFWRRRGGEWKGRVQDPAQH